MNKTTTHETRLLIFNVPTDDQEIEHIFKCTRGGGWHFSCPPFDYFSKT